MWIIIIFFWTAILFNLQLTRAEYTIPWWWGRCVFRFVYFFCLFVFCLYIAAVCLFDYSTFIVFLSAFLLLFLDVCLPFICTQLLLCLLKIYITLAVSSLLFSVPFLNHLFDILRVQQKKKSCHNVASSKVCSHIRFTTQ